VPDRADRFGLATPSAQLDEVGGEIGALGADGGPRALGELVGEPSWSRAGSSRASPAGRFVVAGACSGPRSEVPDSWEHGHVQAALGDQDLRGVCLDAGDRAQQLDDLGVWGEHDLDPLSEVLQRGVERVDVREQLGDHHPVVLDLKAALERFAQLRDLQAHPRLGELGELLSGSLTPDRSASSIARADFE
jgi:hypothetical protein